MKAFIIAIFIFLVAPAEAQQQGQARLDSLLTALRSERTDTSKVRLLTNIAYTCYGINPADGMRYADSALTLATAIGWQEGIADAHNKKGINYYIESDYTRALSEQMAARAIYEELGLQAPLARVLIGIGSIYTRQDANGKAIEYYTASLRINQAIGDLRGAASAYGSIGNAYKAQDDYVRALEYQEKALHIFEQLPYKDMLAICLENIGATYYEQRRWSPALAYYHRALRIAVAIGYDGYKGEYLVNIAKVYLDFAKDSLATSAARGSEDSLLPASRSAALQSAEKLLAEAIPINRAVRNQHVLAEACKTLAQVKALLGNYRGAYDAFVASKGISDSVFSAEKVKTIEGMETQRALALKDKQIEIDRLAVAKKRNERVFFIGGMLLLAGLSAVAIRGRRKSDALLLNILPSDVARELKQKGASAARQFEEVTVLFTDFVAFTQAGERMSAQALVAELDTCFKAFDAIISKHGIEKIKTIGDAYLAVGGLPRPDAGHARNIVAAAVEIRDFMIRRKATPGADSFEIRIGVHSGPVVAGIVGVKKFAYDIWGDTVNTAARMEQSSEAGRINISETTYALVKAQYTCSYRGEVDAKNKGALKMYFVEGEIVR